MKLEELANALEIAERQRATIEPISESLGFPITLEQAYRINEQIAVKRINGGNKLSGFKVGLTNPLIRQKIGWPDSIYGNIFKPAILDSGHRISLDELIQPKLECEMCFRLSRNIEGKKVTVEEVFEATDGVCAALEICDSRLSERNRTFADLTADNALAGRFVLSNTWYPVDKFDLDKETVNLTHDNQKIAEGTGSAVMDHPANAIIWLAKKLAERNKRINANQIVMTGSLTPILPVEQNSTYVAHFSNLGKVTLDFT